MFQLFSVFVLSGKPSVLEFQSHNGLEFKRANVGALVYIAPLEVRLAEDGLSITTHSGHHVGRVGEWSEYAGVRTFWSQDLDAIQVAAEEVYDPQAA